MNTSRGFTLIELLVVISIIGLLSSVVLASLSAAKGKAYDAKRLLDMQSIQTALELYRSSNGAYPITASGSWASQCVGWGGLAANSVIPGLVPTYLPNMPADPQMVASSNQNCYLYVAINGGANYKILDYNLTNTNVATQPNFIDPARNFGVPTRPPSCGAGYTEATFTWAIWSDNASMCA
jgi:type II secretion system protein G